MDGLILLSGDFAINYIRQYFGNIKELHFYAKHPISQPKLSYDFPNLPSIVSNIDTDPSFENETLEARKSVRARTWGKKVEEQVGRDNFCGTQGSGVKMDINNGNNYKDTEINGARGRFQQYKKYCHKLNIDTMLDISMPIGVR
ncbi:hypothetical protein GH714_015593 [Hevea brasiliensis]|uniref:Uncharacterized protein n=1 Tax=Hevea brasiliensis TaxID=3981 RepID=A0A6A6L4W0_HEVBR|nr:hypothetical protein GH714_015593 [Hevea brasiliensis]